MSENINFIPAAELPEAKGRELELLCLENGELKRSANAGGGGYVIHVPASDVTSDDETGNMTVVLSESYDNFAPILAQGGSVWLDISQIPIFIGSGLGLALTPVIFAAYGPELGGIMMMSMNPLNNGMMQIMCSNGSWTPAAMEA